MNHYRSWPQVLLSVLLAAHVCASGATRKSSTTSRPAAKSSTLARNPYLGALVVDADTGKVLFEERADAKAYPASLVKLMDLLIILEKVEHHELSFRDPVPVSARATEAAPSKVYLERNESFSVDEMLYALMLRSANDAAIALAEKAGGSEEGFIALMNKKARDLGMTSTEFHSANGLPPPRGQPYDVTTARDLALLCREVLKHPDALRYTSTRNRTFRPNAGKKSVPMVNHNHLLRTVPGCDGLKTGYFEKAGFSIAATAARSGRRVIAIVLGSPDSKTRDHNAAELLSKGFAGLGTAPSSARRTGR